METMGLGHGQTLAHEDRGSCGQGATQPAAVVGGDADTILDPAGLGGHGRRVGLVTVRSWPGAGHHGCDTRARWTEMLSATT